MTRYKVLVQHGAGSVWVSVNHANFIDGIQNGGLRYFGDKRQKILNFAVENKKESIHASI